MTDSVKESVGRRNICGSIAFSLMYRNVSFYTLGEGECTEMYLWFNFFFLRIEKLFDFPVMGGYYFLCHVKILKFLTLNLCLLFMSLMIINVFS